MNFKDEPFLLVEGNDLASVITFLKNVPDILERIFKKENSDLLEIINQDTNHGISSALFLEAFEEAKKTFNDNLNELIAPHQIQYSGLEENLKKAGFTGSSLKLKAALLNKLWKDVVKYVDIDIFFKRPYMRIFDKALKKLIELFLKFLNSLLGSLLSAVPGIEPMKELKEFLEHYVETGEEIG